MIEVIATQDGMYPYGTLRQRSAKFTVEYDDHVSKRWMARKGTAKYDATDRSYGFDAGEHEPSKHPWYSPHGVVEQLAIALEEGRKLKAQVRELEAELTLVREANPDNTGDTA